MPDDTNGQVGRRSFLKATGAAGAATSLGVTTVSAGRNPRDANVQDETIIFLSASANFEKAARKTAERLNVSVEHRLEALNAIVVSPEDGPSATSVEDVQTQAAREPDVVDTESQGYFVPLEANDPGIDQQYAPEQTRATEVWDESLGSEEVSVAVIDSGTDYEHPDLRDRFDQRTPGIAPASRGDDPTDTATHGTHVAGIVGATTDNRSGVAGMANCRLYAVQALGETSPWDNVAEGIRWAADQGVDIINMSLGDPQGRQPKIVQRAARYARDRGVLLVAAAGNEAKQRNSVLYPAGFDECMAVSGLDANENLGRFSSRGPEVELSGPGANVLSTVPGGDYGKKSGTSMAAPAVAGSAALAKSFNTNLSNTELRAAMKETARDVGLRSNDQGAGCVDAKALVERVRDDGGRTDPDPNPEPDPDPGCGGTRETASASDSLSFWSTSKSYTYFMRTSDPCQVEVDLQGPSDADFDLYVTLDGRTPTPDDFDKSSTGPGGNEAVLVDDLDPATELGIRVEASSGYGGYEITAEEIGS
jgi:serine protease